MSRSRDVPAFPGDEVVWLEELRRDDVERGGGKGANLGELIAAEDIFFLETSEIETAAATRSSGQARPELVRLARERRELREARKRLHPPATTPAWTPLFSQARGLVTDIGGVLAHGSIVVREFGIPAVLGTGAASQRIHHGQRVTVDGDRGVVLLEVDGEPPCSP